MKKIILIGLFLLIGCSDPNDQASANLKKGDEFYAKNEYEIAEYYYEKIPEESPFYRLAERRLSAIASIKEKWKVIVSDSSAISRIILVDNKYNTDNVSRVPLHSITLRNNTMKRLESVDIEFTYYNQSGRVLKTLISEVKTPLAPNTQAVFDNVSPGLLEEKFDRCDAKIINVHF